MSDQHQNAALDLVARVQNLVSLPDIYVRVKAVIDDPDSSVADLAAIIEYEPALTARVLALANSPFFGLVSRVDTVQRATNLLGAIQIHNLVLATASADAFANTSPRNFNPNNFWVDSVHSGLLANHLALKLGLDNPDRFFVAGLLHDIGHLVIDQVEPELFSTIIEEQKQSGELLYDIENARLNTNYADIGATLMRSWQFPKSLVNAIEFQHHPNATQPIEVDAAILHTACFLLQRNAGLPIPAERMIEPEAYESLALDETLLSEVKEIAHDELENCVKALFPNSDAGALRAAG